MISITSGDLLMKSNYQDFQRLPEVDLAIAHPADPWRISCGRVRSNPIPRVWLPIFFATTAARSWSRPEITTSRPCFA